MKRDLLALLDYAQRNWPTSPITVVATSLAGRVALKATSLDPRIKLLVLLTGVVDVQATLLAVHQEDLIGTYLRGTRRGVINMLGFNIDADGWLEDASKEGYGDLQTTIKDAERIRATVVFFSAEHDTWVSLDSVKAVQAALQPALRKLYLIPEALHRLHENPRKARAVFRHLVTCCLEKFYPLSRTGNLREPSQREVGLQNRLERERARVQHQMAKTENVEFWKDYLEHFHYIANVADFWQLLDHIYRLAGAFEKGERILDAGCGNGNFAMFLLINQAYRQRSGSTPDLPTLRYVGVDFVLTALLQARLTLACTTDELRKKQLPAIMTQPLVTASLSLADLNMPLPFRDNQFDRIVSNLVLGYLRDPLFTLRELLRVLAPNGKLVLTNLKPQADLSKIYRNFVAKAERAEEVEEGRQLLNNSGKIKQGESDGVFRFFDKQELAMLLIASGAPKPRIYSTFANQAYIAVAEKPGTLYASSFTV
jgi:SAM-dependent methyltransferase